MTADGNESMTVPALKDDEDHPIPSAWRPVICRIVDAFVRHDYGLAGGIPGVAPVSPDTAAQIRDYIADYGDTLIPLPDEAWATSVCRWAGSYWDASIDLWTLDEGGDDLVLQLRVREAGAGFAFEIALVYVP